MLAGKHRRRHINRANYRKHTRRSGEGGDVEEGAITFGSTTWSNRQASITVSTRTTYQIEYKLSSPEVDEGWIEIENNGTISGLSHGDTVYARLTDGNNHGDYAVASIQDGINPTVNVTSGGAPTSNSISVNGKRKRQRKWNGRKSNIHILH